MNDELLFAAEVPVESSASENPWKIIIADDEDEVHAVTRMVLDNFWFEGRSLELLSAYSGRETKELLRQHPDTAVLLLDVVMEEDTTGLEVVKYIRSELKNHFVRIILRTGQPGQAPERQLTMEYDINDYKEKTELTAQKLFTTIIGLLRAYRDLRMIERNRRGLERIAAISASLFEQQSLKNFVLGLLFNLATLLQFEKTDRRPESSGVVVTRQDQDFFILAGIGEFNALEGQPIQTALPAAVLTQIDQARAQKHSQILPHAYVGHFTTTSGSEHVVYVQTQTAFNDIDQELINVLEVNIAVAFENIDLNQAIVRTQREVIFTLGEIVESRSLRTKEHIKNVAAYSYLLARKIGLDEDTANTLRLASPLHDVGTLGIPDEILRKQTPLTAAEMAEFQKHPLIGYKILQGAKQYVLQVAAQLALQHHERWDGAGFPKGLRGAEIHLFARITNLADTFDELTRTCTGSAHSVKEVMKTFFRERQGTQFDPELVALLLADFEEFWHIYQKTQTHSTP